MTKLMLLNVVITEDNISTTHVCLCAQNNSNVAQYLCSHTKVRLSFLVLVLVGFFINHFNYYLVLVMNVFL